jgi:hypothetical protein
MLVALMSHSHDGEPRTRSHLRLLRSSIMWSAILKPTMAESKGPIAEAAVSPTPVDEVRRLKSIETCLRRSHLAFSGVHR